MRARAVGLEHGGLGHEGLPLGHAPPGDVVEDLGGDGLGELSSAPARVEARTVGANGVHEHVYRDAAGAVSDVRWPRRRAARQSSARRRAGSTSAPTRSIWSTRSAEVASGDKDPQVERVRTRHRRNRRASRAATVVGRARHHHVVRLDAGRWRRVRRRVGHPCCSAKEGGGPSQTLRINTLAPSRLRPHRYRRARVPHPGRSARSAVGPHRPAPPVVPHAAPPRGQHGDGRGAEGTHRRIAPGQCRIAGQCAHRGGEGVGECAACGARSRTDELEIPRLVAGDERRGRCDRIAGGQPREVLDDNDAGGGGAARSDTARPRCVRLQQPGRRRGRWA